MEAMDEYLKLKAKVVILNLGVHDSLIDVVSVPIYCSWLNKNEKLFELYTRLIDIYNANQEAITDITGFIQDLDRIGKQLDIKKAEEELAYISKNIMLQEASYTNIINFVNIMDDFEYSGSFKALYHLLSGNIDDKIFDNVQANNALIKELRKERRDLIE